MESKSSRQGPQTPLEPWTQSAAIFQSLLLVDLTLNFGLLVRRFSWLESSIGKRVEHQWLIQVLTVPAMQQIGSLLQSNLFTIVLRVFGCL
ncbi:hypothetical protein K1719_031425 [Acacia pycnantha]|nr:hypothetical protein K1719_031425 [Acacia pycnantha]